MKIGFLGTGHITSSVIEGIFKSKLKIKKIYISPRNRLISKKLSRKFKKIAVSKNNQQLINRSNWLFLAVTPKVGHKILEKLNFRSNQKIVSFISTINLELALASRENLLRLVDPIALGEFRWIVYEKISKSSRLSKPLPLFLLDPVE